MPKFMWFSKKEIDPSNWEILCHNTTAKAMWRGERNRGYALLMMANKPETALYAAPTFSLLLVELVHVRTSTERICNN